MTAERYKTALYDEDHDIVLSCRKRDDEACEIAQEAFLAAFPAIGKFRGDAKFSTWIYGIAVNVSRTTLKQKAQHRQRTVSIDNPADGPAGPRGTVGRQLGLHPPVPAGRRQGPAGAPALRERRGKVLPPHDGASKRVKAENIPDRECIFIVDVSGSMRGFPLEISNKFLQDLVRNNLPNATCSPSGSAPPSTATSSRGWPLSAWASPLSSRSPTKPRAGGAIPEDDPVAEVHPDPD
jgi:hypothetical protein